MARRIANLLGCMSLLLGAASGGRLDEVARRGGFNKQTLKDVELRRRGLDERATNSRRYYNDKTKGWYD